LRWQAPQAIEYHNDYDPSTVIDATQQGPECIQDVPFWSLTNTTPAVQPGAEDCLLLDVLVPQTVSGPSIPVIVEIHGGGYAGGNSETYPGYALVNQSQGNLIYVSIQYRLGALGFPSSAEVRENGVANAGLLDQRAALMWVQRNIRAFGGDPAKVTIMGGSAGGGSVLNQMLLYGGEANPPFRAAIAERPWVSQSRHNLS
jgi:carboxylesterase type B